MGEPNRKELSPKHQTRAAADGPFVGINCAALPEQLLESDSRPRGGRFTGAKKGGKQGLFEMAHNGTIFLDEIGEISPFIQCRLLRVLQKRSCCAWVANAHQRGHPIIAATNQEPYTIRLEGSSGAHLLSGSTS
jgi:transcriptional regulator with PAS, ATPase and Fis domain